MIMRHINTTHEGHMKMTTTKEIIRELESVEREIAALGATLPERPSSNTFLKLPKQRVMDCLQAAINVRNAFPSVEVQDDVSPEVVEEIDRVEQEMQAKDDAKVTKKAKERKFPVPEGVDLVTIKELAELAGVHEKAVRARLRRTLETKPGRWQIVRHSDMHATVVSALKIAA